MTLDDLNNLDPQQFGNWPIPVKGIIIALLCVALLGAGYWFITKEQLIKLDGLKNKEVSLKQEFTRKQKRANTLQQLKDQLAQIEEIFGELLKRLPKEAEVPELLRQISSYAQSNNLDVKYFKPERERSGSDAFYKELPITIRLQGSYHALGQFSADIARMERIVTQHNISIAPVANTAGELLMSTTAKTYRYKEDDEEK
ncbi:type IV pilus inner membrane component PilO [Candidatus Venteria ishoeyi]|uniref:Pilus assembly protein, PilO n=1 Tax=Candidatus Venteria ishoeyi TaxID=1899563 RepID=A0A1H6F590_9GAMM|nr:type 4a pilus biogenesis protein PilO [Candidatus Venteria ishoeyi]SEH04439.1 Pilus assembly protein%2C PilO [Candidatus Venteria ishoeyi]SEH04998.1 Pilus assembly protein%2C PilO [Candidatus Venteria ishoeyi]